tara:strand:- start:40 stop:1197 length:1158 start_codon:yes stop_codon:yes gene_type:complete
LAPALAQRGHDVVFLSKSKEWHAPEPIGFRWIVTETHRSGGCEFLHPYLRRFDQAVLEGQGVFRACLQLSSEGWEPDLMITHVGFGNGLYLRDAFPKARKFGFFEWYYNSSNSDVDFLQPGPIERDKALRLRTWNAQTLMELADCDVGVVPTYFQYQQFPDHLTSKLVVAHEGVDVEGLSALRQNRPQKPSCLPQSSQVEVLTYVSRGFEEYRGFSQAMQTIEILQKRRPNLHVLIVGSDLVAYGSGRSDKRSWGEWARADLSLDLERTHWMGPLQTSDYHAVLAWSDVHLYLTVPFVLSWSLIEAMAARCCIVGSATPPVEELLQEGRSARIVDFFDVSAQVRAIEELLDNPGERQRLAAAAALKAREYSSADGLERWLQLIEL